MLPSVDNEIEIEPLERFPEPGQDIDFEEHE